MLQTIRASKNQTKRRWRSPSVWTWKNHTQSCQRRPRLTQTTRWCRAAGTQPQAMNAWIFSRRRISNSHWNKLPLWNLRICPWIFEAVSKSSSRNPRIVPTSTTITMAATRVMCAGRRINQFLAILSKQRLLQELMSKLLNSNKKMKDLRKNLPMLTRILKRLLPLRRSIWMLFRNWPDLKPREVLLLLRRSNSKLPIIKKYRKKKRSNKNYKWPGNCLHSIIFSGNQMPIMVLEFTWPFLWYIYAYLFFKSFKLKTKYL